MSGSQKVKTTSYLTNLSSLINEYKKLKDQDIQFDRFHFAAIQESYTPGLLLKFPDIDVKNQKTLLRALINACLVVSKISQCKGKYAI